MKAAAILFISATIFFSGCIEIVENPPQCTTPNLVMVATAGKAEDGLYTVKFSDQFPLTGLTSGSYDNRQQQMRTLVSTFLLDITGNIEILNVYTEVFKGFTARLNTEQLNFLRAHPAIDIIEKVNKVGKIQTCEVPEEADKGSQESSYAVDRLGSASAVGKRVWIIDTGVDLDHPDLTVNITLSRNFVLPTDNADDDDGHGTHVAGIVAAKNNAIGSRGIAFGATVVAVKVLDNLGEGSSNTVIQGIDYVTAIASAGEVMNLSLGGDANSLVDLSVQTAGTKGIFVTIAAGNESESAATKSPARAQGANLFTISAIDQNDRFASFSNFGNPPVDYAEPGVAIRSTYKDGTYRVLSGTSMAAPHMAGILLVRGRAFNTDGRALNDPDGSADPIAVAR